MNDVLELPFDQYQRYRLVADLLDHLRPKDRTLSILDVGGRTALLRSFAPADDVTLVDLEASDEPGLVIGSGAALPFTDDAFEVVCAFDTLEHVPPPRRASFVRECARVSRGWVLLAGPYDAPRVAEAEELLQAFLRDKLRTRHRYLDEHRAHGLPDRAATEAQLRELGCRVTTVGHGSLDRWFALMCLALYLDDDPALRGLAKRVHRFYNASLYAGDHTEPVYRHVVVAAHEGHELPDVDGLFAPAGAPPGTLAAFSELTDGLVAFDVEREAWRDEKEEWKAIEAALEADLRGHRERSETLAADLGKSERELERLRLDLAREEREGREAIAALRRDLGEHERKVAALEKELERERREDADARAALQQDLAAHQEALAEERAERAAHVERGRELEGELATTRTESAQVIDALERDLTGHREALAQVRAEVHAQRERAEAAEAEQAALRAHADELERRRADERARANAHRAELSAEIEALRAHAADVDREHAAQAERAQALEAELGRINELASATNDSLVEANARLAETTSALEAERAEVARLRAELSSRWRNVRRALTFRAPRTDG